MDEKLYLLLASRNGFVGFGFGRLVARRLLRVHVLGGATVHHFRVSTLLANLLATLSLLGRGLLFGRRLSVGIRVLQVEDIDFVLETEVLGFSEPRFFLRI